MSYEMLVGLNLKDEKVYQDYRNAMRPLLETYGGGFRYDFKVEKVLKSEVDHPINRVFVIYFRDQKASENFFSNPEYLKIKKTYFEVSVLNTVRIADYSRGEKS